MRGWGVSSNRSYRCGGAASAGRAGSPDCGIPRAGHACVRTVLVVSTLAIGLGAGCASRPPAGVPAPVPTVPAPEPGAAPVRPVAMPPDTSGERFPPLPGTTRDYPSRDARNHPGPGAPEAFPLPGPGAAAVEPGVLAEMVGEARAAELAAADPPAAMPDDVPPAAPVASEQMPGDSVAVSLPTSAVWSVQLLASSSSSVARERAAGLSRYFAEPPRVEAVGGLFKVRVGRCATRDEAETLRRKAQSLGLRDAFVVAPEAGGAPPR